MAKALGVDKAKFEPAWRHFRQQRDSGELGSVEAAIGAALGRLGVRANAENIEAAKAIRYRSIRESLEPRPGAVDLLRVIRIKGHSLGLLSNCSCEVPEVWSGTPFANSFDATVFSASEGLLKPERALYMRIAERLGVLPERCLYVGDGGSDELDGASAVGMSPWLLLLPHEDPPTDEKHAASVERWRSRHLRSLTEVLGVLDAAEMRNNAVSVVGEYPGRPRVSAAVFRANKTEILMVKHQREDGTTYWQPLPSSRRGRRRERSYHDDGSHGSGARLPGSGLLPSERPEDAVSRELLEETGLIGKVTRKLFTIPYKHGMSTTFLVEVGMAEEAKLGCDPEESGAQHQKLVDLAWIPITEARDNPEIKQLLKVL